MVNGERHTVPAFNATKTVIRVLKSLIQLSCYASLAILLGCAGSGQSSGQKKIRILTYNIHHGVGSDSTFNINRLASVIRRSDVDIVALQDVDRWVERTRKLDIMTTLADLTGMTYTFAKSRNIDGGENGIGLLTRFPILEEKHLMYHLQIENQECVLLNLVLDVEGTEIAFMNTTLNYGLDDSVQNENVSEIKAAAREYRNIPMILCLSLNFPLRQQRSDAGMPDGQRVASLAEIFQDCWTVAGSGSGFTYPSSMPKYRFDYIFGSRNQPPTDTRNLEVDLNAKEARVLDSNASDHLPLLTVVSAVSE